MENLAWTDLTDDADGAWTGLLVNGRPRRPPLHVQAGPGRRMRVCSDGAPFLWARVADDHYGYAYVRTRPGRTSPRVLPPFGFASSRSTGARPGSPAWLRHWSTVVATGLAHGANAALAGGTTFIGPCEALRGEGRLSGRPRRVYVPAASRLEQTMSFTAHAFEPWDLFRLPPLALRSPSPASDGRVKAFRKLAREGVLPPVVLRWVAGLQRYLVLDGHDRLHAALLEDVAPPCLAVLDLTPAPSHFDATKAAAVASLVAQALASPPLPGRPTFTVADANRLLIGAFDTRDALLVTTRAWPLDGGPGAWDAEVRARLAGDEGDEVLLAS